MSEIEWVWIHDERIYGELVHYGATYSKVRYEKMGQVFEDWIENDDFEFRSERAFEYEQDTE